jgi:hypothetical protein
MPKASPNHEGLICRLVSPDRPILGLYINAWDFIAAPAQLRPLFVAFLSSRTYLSETCHGKCSSETNRPQGMVYLSRLRLHRLADSLCLQMPLVG